MKREIKFRAWHNENRYMVTSDRGVYTALQHALNVTVSSGFSDIDTSAKPYKYTLMQYTGFKDKKGKEIYEGDIVKLSVFGDYEINLEVVFKDGGFVCIHDGDCLDEYLLSDVSNGIIVVIGNIYENPELLGVEP